MRDTIAELRQEAEAEDMDFSWLERPAAERGHSVSVSKRGLTLDDISLGELGKIPATTKNRSGALRGSKTRADAQMLAAHWPNDSSWSDNVRLLYEEALQRQWSSATDIPWHEMPEIDEKFEYAMSQICTFLTQVEFIAGDAPGKFVPNIGGDYFEVGLFLATQIMDEARHLDVFRKRALANGIGLLQAGIGAQGLLAAEDFVEMTAQLHLVAEGFIQSMFRMGELFAQTDVDKRMFRLAAQDESRHVAFGVMHMKHVLEQEPERREEVHAYLDRVEGVVGVVNNQSLFTAGGGPVGESMVILLGGGTSESQLGEGVKKLLAIRKRQINEYMHRLEVIGLGDRRDRMNPRMRMFLDPARN